MGCWVSCVEFDNRITALQTIVTESEDFMKVCARIIGSARSFSSSPRPHRVACILLLSLVRCSPLQECKSTIAVLKKKTRSLNEAHVLEMRVQYRGLEFISLLHDRSSLKASHLAVFISQDIKTTLQAINESFRKMEGERKGDQVVRPATTVNLCRLFVSMPLWSIHISVYGI